MLEVLNSTAALRRVMQAYLNGYVVWVSFVTGEEKVAAKALQWERDFGTELLVYQKQDIKERLQPTATATSTMAQGSPSSRELVLMATRFALTAHPASPWTKERWNVCPPRIGAYVMVHSPRQRRDYAWTWNLEEGLVVRLSKRLTHLVKTKNAFAVRAEIESWGRIFSMYRGVRGQLAKLIRSAQKLWRACHRETPWPGIEPDDLPFVTQFRRQRA